MDEPKFKFKNIPIPRFTKAVAWDALPLIRDILTGSSELEETTLTMKRETFNMGPFVAGPFCTLPFGDSPFGEGWSAREGTIGADLNNFVRSQIREDSLYRRIMLPLEIGDRILLERDIITDDPIKVLDGDIRQTLADNAIKDILAEEDSKFIATLNAVVGKPVPLLQVPTEVGQFTCDMIAAAQILIPRINPEPVLISKADLAALRRFGKEER